MDSSLATAIREMDFLAIQRMPDNAYIAVRNLNSRQIALLDRLGIWESDLDYFATQETERITRAVFSQVAYMPSPHKEKKNAPKKRGRGRPKGSTNQKANELSEEKRKPGRPKGSKNKPKEENIIPDGKRRPGRPKGSKNKKDAVNAKFKRAEQKKEQNMSNNLPPDSI